MKTDFLASMAAAGSNSNVKLLIAILIFVVLVIVVFPIIPWFKARLHGIRIHMFYFQSMRNRRLPINKILSTLIRAVKADLSIPITYLEVHLQAGGDIDKVVDALIKAKEEGVDLSFEQAAAIDIAGGDILQVAKEKSQISK